MRYFSLLLIIIMAFDSHSRGFFKKKRGVKFFEYQKLETSEFVTIYPHCNYSLDYAGSCKAQYFNNKYYRGWKESDVEKLTAALKEIERLSPQLYSLMQVLGIKYFSIVGNRNFRKSTHYGAYIKMFVKDDIYLHNIIIHQRALRNNIPLASLVHIIIHEAAHALSNYTYLESKELLKDMSSILRKYDCDENTLKIARFNLRYANYKELGYYSQYALTDKRECFAEHFAREILNQKNPSIIDLEPSNFFSETRFLQEKQ